MAGKLRTRSGEIIRTLESELPDLMIRHAGIILARSNATIRANVGAKGVALGSGENEEDLADSGYIVYKGYSGYADARSRAATGRDARRGLWAPEVEIEESTKFIVKAAYALDRAALMHEGYLDPRLNSNGWMQGTPFLWDATQDDADDYFKDVAALVKGLEGIRLPTLQEDKEAARERAELAELRRAARASSQAERSQREMFRESIDPGVFETDVNRLRVKGYTREYTRGIDGKRHYTGRMKPVYYRETAVEKADRIEQVYQEWLRARSSQPWD